MTFETLCALGPAGWHALLRNGRPVDLDGLADTAWRGTALGLPRFVERLTWKSFVKTFARDGDGLRGWNVRIDQTGLHGPIVPRFTFGHYRVVPRATWPVGCPGVELDYGRVKDPLVAVDDDLLLGWTWLAVGRMHVGTPSFFALRRLGPLADVAA